MEVIGFHNIDDNLFTDDDSSFAEHYYDAQNILNILGWIPALGSIIGGIRVASTIIICIGDNNRCNDYHKQVYTVSSIRGTAEILSLGWVFIIPDLVISYSSQERNFKFRNIFKRKVKK